MSANSKQMKNKQGSSMFFSDMYYQKTNYSNHTCLAVAIADIIIQEGLDFNISQKYRFKKVLDLARNVSKGYTSPNRKLMPTDLLDGIHDQKMKKNLTIMSK